MVDARLSALVAAELDEHRRNLSELAEKAQKSVLGTAGEVLLSQVLGGCRQILDRAMNAVWAAHGQPNTGSQKPNVYFPCYGSPEKLTEVLRKYQLAELDRSNARAYRAIRSRQPFMGAQNSWLRELFDLTKNRHEGYVEIDSATRQDMSIGMDQPGWMSELIIFNDGSYVTDATAPLNLSFTDRLEHVLRMTQRNPIQYCSDCVTHVDEVFTEVVSALPKG